MQEQLINTERAFGQYRKNICVGNTRITVQFALQEEQLINSVRKFGQCMKNGCVLNTGRTDEQ